MKICDMIGNELHSGSTVFWKGIGAVCQIADLQESGQMTLLLKIPFKLSKPDTYLDGFITVVNPVEQENVQKIVEKLKELDRPI